MYGMPQPNTYGQYGFGAYSGAPATTAPGMPSPPAATTSIGMAPAPSAADPAAATSQVTANQWGGTDPSYYPYWNGEAANSADGFGLLNHSTHRLLQPATTNPWR